ncbi:MAG TPA: FlgO family outer membrane protein, partial [Fibrobacteraceae bacterium]|nr:FlgO family outer membrane protein [Fibrobacteraceae bacterium]
QARHDSILQYAQDHPANTLPEFFSRIFTQVPASPQIVAVLPFGVKGTGNLDYNASIMAAEYFIAELSKDPHYQVLDRASMEKIQAALSQDPELAPDTQVAQAGEKAAAQWVLVGTVGFLGDNQIFSAHLVQVETGEVFSAATALVGDKEVREDYLNSVGTRLAPSSAMWRSLLFPGWGQIYAHHTIHGAMWSALAVGATAYTIWAINHYPTQEVKFQMGLTSSATNQRNVAIAMLASVWTVNLIDTWIVAHQENNRVKTSYFSSQVAIAPLIKENSAGLLLAGRF